MGMVRIAWGGRRRRVKEAHGGMTRRRTDRE
jgi:hypothetical protein